METEKLYYTDPFLTTFTAKVLSCEAGKGGYLVTLDRTAFYPEGGGQPADHGTLGGIAVTDVHEKDGVVIHTVEKAVEIGENVTGRIDWARRFDHMQQHSGEHILSGILCRDYHCDNVGFHLGADTVTIDYNTDISWEEALAAEYQANQVIWADAPVEITYPSPAELEQLDYRSKKALTGKVRIVTFPEADCCACCGTHVLRAGQVGIIKVLSCQKFRSGVRMEILCGERAWRYLSGTYDQAHAVGQHLSVKPLEAAAAVERLTEELTAAKARMAELEGEVFSHKAHAYCGKGDVVLVEPSLRPDGVRRLADAVAKECGGLAAVFAGEDGRYNYALVRADGADIAPLVKAMNAALTGRGGGRSGFAQGSVQTDADTIHAFFNNFAGKVE
ncbi:alanyl-tRNA editing protein [Dysosmobacter sp.]|uniref:alanyl-tRNA editing protein n=1 Tax=Dysosmobacter sp. TaxID=2591382 RepID=UPI003FD7DAA9